MYTSDSTTPSLHPTAIFQRAATLSHRHHPAFAAAALIGLAKLLLKRQAGVLPEGPLAQEFLSIASKLTALIAPTERLITAEQVRP